MNGALHSILSSPSNPSTSSAATKTTRRPRRKNKQIYLIFERWAKECEDDVFWRNFFQSAANGSLPNKFHIANNQLICEIRKRRAITITEHNLNEVKNFIIRMGIVVNRAQAVINKREQNPVINEWNTIRKNKTVAYQYLKTWALHQKQLYNLNQIEFERLLALLNYAKSVNQLTNDTVVISHCKIENISNIVFEPAYRTFILTPPPNYRFTQSTSKTKPSTKLSFTCAWDNYINAVQNYTKNN